MAEIVPPEQNLPSPWRQQLPLHHELAGTLKPEETLALMGSWAERDLADLGEVYEPGTKEHTRQEAVYGAALEQLAELRSEEGDSMVDVMETLYGRQRELKDALRRSDSQTENIRISEQLAGIKLLDAIRFRVTDHVGLSAEMIGSKISPRDRAAAINEMITEHNEWISRGSETTTDSPEMREAQERISAHYAERARQARPAGTVDGARQKVAEAFGGLGEKERQALISEVAQAARGTTLVYTDIPKDLMAKSPSGELYRPIDGFNGFGDGLEPESDRRHQRLKYEDSPEAFLFEPATTTRHKTVIKTVETGGRFRKETERVEEEVPDGEVPTMVINPATGQQELGVRVAYQFNSNDIQYSRDAYDGKVPWYRTEGGRAGNQLWVEATLPKSVADKLKQEVSRNPRVAREFARTLALNNGITEQTWDNVVRPPYDQLPSDWEMAVVDMHKDGKLHQVTSQQSVKAPK